ncbi:MAG: alpha/beta hydrolase [Bacteroidales bacterium]|nr:alpha/beta hydrolase [Bacteroidales bacterium]
MKKLFIILFLFPLLLDAQETICDTVVPQTYEYVRYGDRAMLLDIYKPKVARADSACVVYMFGGGFAMGSRTVKNVREFCQKLAQRGFTAVAIDYRLHIPEVNFDTVSLFNMRDVFRDAIYMATEDASASVAYLCSNAAKLGISSDRIVLCGSSAGAITSLQLDYCRANELAPASTLPTGWKPAAVVAFSGAIYADGERPKYAKSPAPTFFLHGNADKIVNYKKFPPLLRSGLYGPKKLHKIFEKEGYPHWLFIFEGLGHEIAAQQMNMYEEFEAFVNKTLAGNVMHYDATVRDDEVKPTKWSKMNVFDLYNMN